MSTIHPYLTFNGNCREAMTFYQKSLGGALHFQTFGESPLSEKMSRRMRNCILHATLTNGSFILMASDIVGEKGLLKGNSVSLVLDCKSEKGIRECYKKLSQGGEQTHPLKSTLWNALFGGLTDKYGNNWLLNYARSNQQKE